MVGIWPRGRLWRHGDFLKLWSAETISQFGTQVTTGLALPLVAVITLNVSAFEVSALVVVPSAATRRAVTAGELSERRVTMKHALLPRVRYD